MSHYEIKDLEDLVVPILNSNQRFVEAKIVKLTETGDNYASLMLRLDVTIEDDQNQTDCLHLVAKMLPETEYLQKLFYSEVTFRNEVGFYKTIAPCLRQLQQEQGLDELFNAFPAFYGARISLKNNSDKVDENAVLLIKNIKEEGFINIEKTVGFDRDQTELILKKLAELHATVLAFKMLKSEDFEEKLTKFFKEYSIFDSVDDSRGFDQICKILIDIVREDEFCSRHLGKIQETVINMALHGGKRNNKQLQKGPFLSFVHNDLWINNIMVKTIDDKTTDVKFVDFQLYEHNSSIKDVIFFLFTSVEFSVIQQHCDELLVFYYDNFINYLKKLNCGTSAFSFKIFTEEIKRISRQSEYFHIIFMLAPIYAKKEDTKENMGLKEMVDQRRNVSAAYKKKACFVTQEFIQRDWI